MQASMNVIRSFFQVTCHKYIICRKEVYIYCIVRDFLKRQLFEDVSNKCYQKKKKKLRLGLVGIPSLEYNFYTIYSTFCLRLSSLVGLNTDRVGKY